MQTLLLTFDCFVDIEFTINEAHSSGCCSKSVAADSRRLRNASIKISLKSQEPRPLKHWREEISTNSTICHNFKKRQHIFTIICEIFLYTLSPAGSLMYIWLLFEVCCSRFTSYPKCIDKDLTEISRADAAEALKGRNLNYQP